MPEQRIRTERESLTAFFGGRPKARILLEAATESEWVARHLEFLGHEVIVADPNFAPMYSSRSRKSTGRPRAVRRLSPRELSTLTPRERREQDATKALGSAGGSGSDKVSHDFNREGAT